MILSVHHLGFTYPRAETPVLKGLDFEIREGEVFGFLGPNGSGKTTTQKLLVRILSGYQGSVAVFGGDLKTLGPDYFNRVGVCFENPNLYGKLTAEENLDFYRAFFDVPTESAGPMLERLSLPAGDRRRVGQFSKGMRMRLGLARSLINSPDLWFLDEPTNAQDPLQAVRIRELIRERAAAGTTVFLTTHNMTLAHELCDRVAFLVDGEIAAIDSPDALIRQQAEKIARVEYHANREIATSEFRMDDPAEKAAFLEVVARHEVETIHTLEPTLEDVFLLMTGKALGQ